MNRWSRAEEQAENFNLPEGWQEGRDQLTGWAIDPAYSPDIDDAISLVDNNAGPELQVNITDVGSFLHKDEHDGILSRVLDIGFTRYKNDQIATPMIPAKISEDKLSLLDGVPRPVITVGIPLYDGGEVSLSRSALTTKRLTHNQVDQIIAYGDDEQSDGLRALDAVARQLFIRRRPELSKSATYLLENELGDPVANFDRTTLVARFMVQECMLAANISAAHFMKRHGIPALYRNHPGGQETIRDARPRAAYAVQSLGHVALNLPDYMHFTSPLRRAADLLNHLNLAAFLDGSPEYPYPEEQLNDLAVKINNLNLSKSKSFDIEPSFGYKFKLLEQITRDNARPTELLYALFKAGDSSIAQDLKQAAGQFLERDMSHAVTLVEMALREEIIELQISEEDDHRRWVVVDRNGVAYPYRKSPDPIHMNQLSARLIGEICGISINPEVDWGEIKKQRILQKGINYLSKLGSQKRLTYRLQVWDEKFNSETYIKMEVAIGDETYIFDTQDITKHRAIKALAVRAITELDLIDNPPPSPQPLATSPVLKLENRRGAQKPEYTISGPDEDKLFACRVIFTDHDGTTYETEHRAPSKKAAKTGAANTIFKSLPQALPKNWKKQQQA